MDKVVHQKDKDSGAGPPAQEQRSWVEWLVSCQSVHRDGRAEGVAQTSEAIKVGRWLPDTHHYFMLHHEYVDTQAAPPLYSNAL